MSKKIIYLDHNATTPTRKEVLAEAMPFFQQKFGNPGSFHAMGLEAKKAITESRKKIAKILECEPEEIIFTGSGTESINTALKGIAFAKILEGKKGHFITQTTEHDAVIETLNWLKKFGFENTQISVNSKGLINPQELENAIRPDTILVSIMYANNETGAVQDIKKISEICAKKNVLLHTDACQGPEYLPISVKKLGVQMMTLNGSKIYGFKGTGLLYFKKGIKFEPLIHGGHQENSLRSGTENVAGIIALAKALEIAEKEKQVESKRVKELRDLMVKLIQKEIKNVKINTPLENSMPNTLNISFEGIEGESILLRLNEDGICASTGSACSSRNLEPSHVLIAMGLDHGLAHGSIRFSLGKNTTKQEIIFTVKSLKKTIKFLRSISPVWRK